MTHDTRDDELRRPKPLRAKKLCCITLSEHVPHAFNTFFKSTHGVRPLLPFTLTVHAHECPHIRGARTRSVCAESVRAMRMPMCTRGTAHAPRLGAHTCARRLTARPRGASRIPHRRPRCSRACAAAPRRACSTRRPGAPPPPRPPAEAWPHPTAGGATVGMLCVSLHTPCSYFQ